jgi:hypothetical protein
MILCSACVAALAGLLLMVAAPFPARDVETSVHSRRVKANFASRHRRVETRRHWKNNFIVVISCRRV